MSSELKQENSLLEELAGGMKASPLETAGVKEPDRKVLYDGYVRQSEAQAMYVTDAYRYRYLRWALLAFLAVALLAMVLLLIL